MVHISNVHFDTFQHVLAYQIITMNKIMSDQNSIQHYWKCPHFLLQPSLSIPNQASVILALQSVRFLYFIQPEVLLTRILSSCVITEPFTHAARIHTPLLFLLAMSELRITKEDHESGLPAVIYPCQGVMGALESQTNWTHGTG